MKTSGVLLKSIVIRWPFIPHSLDSLKNLSAINPDISSTVISRSSFYWNTNEIYNIFSHSNYDDYDNNFYNSRFTNHFKTKELKQIPKLLEYHFDDDTYCYASSVDQVLTSISVPSSGDAFKKIEKLLPSTHIKNLKKEKKSETLDILRASRSLMPLSFSVEDYQQVESQKSLLQTVKVFLAILQEAFLLQKSDPNFKVYITFEANDTLAIKKSKTERVLFRIKGMDHEFDNFLRNSEVAPKKDHFKRISEVEAKISSDWGEMTKFSLVSKLETFCPDITASRWAVSRGLALDCDTGNISFHSMTTLLDQMTLLILRNVDYLQEDFKIYYNGLNLSALGNRDAEILHQLIDGLSKTEKTMSEITDIEEKILGFSTKFKITQSYKNLRIHFSPKNFHLNFEKTKGLKIFHSTENHENSNLVDTPHSLVHFPRFILEYVSCFANGIGGFLNGDATGYAHRNDSLKRSVELKLFRHTGVSLFILLEELSFALGETQSDGRKLKTPSELTEHIYSSMSELLYAKASNVHPRIQAIVDFEKSKRLSNAEVTNSITGAGGSLKKLKKSFEKDKTFKSLLSGGTKNFLNELINQTLNFFSERDFVCYSPEARFVVSGAFKNYLLLLRQWIINLVEKTQGKIFYKTNDSSFSDLLQLLNLHFTCIKSDSIGSVPFIPLNQVFTENFAMEHLSLLEYGFDLKFQNSSVEKMNENDFSSSFKMNSDMNINFFELDPKVFFKGKEIDLNEASFIDPSRGVMEFRGVLYLIPKGQIPKLRTLEKFWKRILNKSNKLRSSIEQKIFKLPKSQTLELLKLRAEGFDIEGNADWKEICDFYDSLETTNGDFDKDLVQKVSESFFSQLKEYQKVGVQWLADLYRLRLGAILADDMGLGKTVQTLAFLKYAVSLDDQPNLVVVPTSLMYNWEAEAQRFAPDLRFYLWNSLEKEEIMNWVKTETHTILVVTYGILAEYPEFFKSISWNVVVFDEAQNLKNITSQKTSLARQLASRFKVCLSGTPFENNFSELYSLIDLVVPGSLGSLSDFHKIFGKDKFESADVASLKQTIKPIILRRTKKQILIDLPPKSTSVTKVKFQEKQKLIYKNVASSMNEQVTELIRSQGESKAQLQMLTAILRLRQICSDPSCLPNTEYTEIPPKIQMVAETVKEHIANGESVLVFTQFRVTQSRLVERIKAERIFCQELHGEISQTQRKKVLTEFNQCEDPSVLVMTLKTGGVGLNLTKASVVIHVEPWWNPAVENQATDRVHRMGQESEVKVYRYIMQDSLEEKIEILKAKKEKNFNLIFESETADIEYTLKDSAPDKSGLYVKESEKVSSRITHTDFQFLIGGT